MCRELKRSLSELIVRGSIMRKLFILLLLIFSSNIFAGELPIHLNARRLDFGSVFDGINPDSRLVQKFTLLRTAYSPRKVSLRFKYNVKTGENKFKTIKRKFFLDFDKMAFLKFDQNELVQLIFTQDDRANHLTVQIILLKTVHKYTLIIDRRRKDKYPRGAYFNTNYLPFP